MYAEERIHHCQTAARFDAGLWKTHEGTFGGPFPVVRTYFMPKENGRKIYRVKTRAVNDTEKK